MSDGWNKKELRASVEAYVEMQRKERLGQPFTKKRYDMDDHVHMLDHFLGLTDKPAATGG